MDLDPDIPVPSIEVTERARVATTPRGQRIRDDQSLSTIKTRSGQSAQRIDCSPSRTSYRSSTPTRNTSRSASVASVRNERSTTPKLDKKRSVPNLSLQSPVQAPHQFRRASSNLNPATPVRNKSPKPKMTPASVAKEYFTRDLRNHSKDSKTVVFTHDACYGHRFSRPKTSRATLESIVERPERIHATLLGASTAYVRLGQRHRDGTNAPHPESQCSAPPFTLIKTARMVPLNHPAVTAVHGTKWMDSLQIMCDSAEARLSLGQKELSRPVGHSKDSKNHTLPALHPGDLYLAAESLNALQGCLGGVYDAIDTVFQNDNQCKRAFVCIRPPGHHCSAEMPSGFCWLNNVHVAISYASMTHGLTHAAIIDFDLHHGDGSQTITWDHNRNAHFAANPGNLPSHKKMPIGYYSLHDINSYPCEYGDEEKVLNASTCLHNAHGQSIWNVHLEPWRSHEDFWRLYETKYRILIDKARSFLSSRSETLRKSGIEPKAAIFLSSGFDASEWEGEGMQRHNVNVPTDFYARITSDIVELASEPETGVAGRVISILEGGYSDRALASGVLSHLCGLVHEPERKSEQPHGLSKMIIDEPPAMKHDPEWWHESNLQMLEAVVAGEIPIPLAQKDKTPNSYSSPTTASTSRMTDTAKIRQSLTAAMEARLWLSNAPPEPVPEVDWMIASYELSRLLIPTERQTLSCTYEELNVETNRTRRDRLSLADLPKSNGTEEKRQLRERVLTQKKDLPTKSASRTSRRTTVAAGDLPDPEMRTRSRSRRRSSAASNMMSEFQELKLSLDSTTSKAPEPRIATVTARKSATSSPKKARAPVRKPAIATASTKTARPATKTASKESSRSRPNSQSAEASLDAMDELTNGMKKINIKLKMPTEEEHLANLRRAETSSSTVVATKSKAVRKPPVPKAPRAVKAKPAVPNMRGANPLDSATSSSIPQATQSGVAKAEVDTHQSRPMNVGSPVQITQPTSSNIKLETVPSISDKLEHTMQTDTMMGVEERKDQSVRPANDGPITQILPAANNDGHYVSYPTINLKFESASPPP